MDFFNPKKLQGFLRDSLSMRHESSVLFLLFSHLNESLREVDHSDRGLPLLVAHDYGTPSVFAKRVYQTVADILHPQKGVKFVWIIPHKMDFTAYFKYSCLKQSIKYPITQEMSHDFQVKTSNWDKHWRVVRMSIDNETERGSFKSFVTMPEVPLLKTWMYYPNERNYLTLEYRDHTKPYSYWLAPDGKHIRDMLKWDMVVVSLISFVR